MSSTSERAWYQDGYVVLMAAGVIAFGVFVWWEGDKQNVHIKVDGKNEGSLLGDETFTLRCWHHFPGTLEKGRVIVSVTGTPLARGLRTKHYSFDEWGPNEEAAIDFRFPLKKTKSETPAVIGVEIRR